MLYAWHTRDMTYSTLREMWSTQTRVTRGDCPMKFTRVNTHVFIYGTAI